MVKLTQDERLSHVIENYNSWVNIANTPGWKWYEDELNQLISIYERYMENEEVSGEMLKHYQLIKKGLKLALNIPKIAENKVKSLTKTKEM